MTSIAGHYARTGIWRFSRRDASLVALAALYAAILVVWPVAPLIAVGVWWNSNTIAHNFIHRPFFRSAGMNRLFSAVAVGFFALFSPRAFALDAVARNPVLLIHGINDTARSMEPLARSLRARGWDVKTMSYRPNWGQKGIEMLAAQVAQFIDANYAPGQKIDLVAFSLGGIVTRYYLQRLGGLGRVQRYVTLSTPHHGTLLAYLIPNAGCRQGPRTAASSRRALSRSIRRGGLKARCSGRSSM